MSPTAPQLADNSLFRTQGFIDGKWLTAKSGNTFDVQDPSTGKVIATIPDMATEEVETAIQAAAATFKSFKKTVPRERSHILRKWYQLIMENADDLATLITLENGKPYAEALGEVKYAADYVEWFSEEAARVGGETIAASTAGRRIYTIHEPVGVCGLVSPWNWPAGMVTRKMAPALAAGCTVVLKPPAETPLTSAALAVLAERAGVPSGAINIVTAHANTKDVGAALSTSPIVKKVSFTGSTGVGKILMKQAAGTLKKLSFELGGNAPFIIFDDADIEKAVQGAIECKFRSSGQTCVCANRIYVQNGVYDKFTASFVEAVKQFKVGSGFTKDVTHGPLINGKAMSKVQEHVEDAVKKGATLLAGGEKLPELGPQFFAPTVLGGMTADMVLCHDETFGPVAGLFPFATEEEVIDLANDTDVGLSGYLYSKDVTRCHRVAEALQVGMVGINTGLISDVAMPFGGIKESGFGREGSQHGMEEYMTVKAVTIGGF